MRTTSRPGHPDELTRRQREVLALLQRGLTNEEIGRELGISADGAKFHVSEILSKLQLSSRHEAASLPEVAVRRRWLGAIAPLPLLRELKWNVLAYGAGAAVTVAALIALGALAWGVLLTEGEAGSPYLVYAHRVGEESEAGRTFPRLELVTYDIEAHERVAAFEVGGAGDYPAQVVAAGDRIVVNLEHSIVSYEPDGSDPRVVVTAGDGGNFIGIGASGDATMLAYTHAQRVLDAGTTEVAVLALESGDELLRLRQSEHFEGFRGQLALIDWRDDGTGFAVFGYTYSEAPGGLATVLLDGRVVVHDGAFSSLAPTARRIATGDIEICSLGTHPEQREIVVRDLDAGAVIASVDAGERNVAWTEWSRDGTELLYHEYAFADDEREGCPVRDESSVTWHILAVDDGSTVPVAGPAAARARWYGEGVLTYYCDGEPVDWPGCFGADGWERPLEVRTGPRLLETEVLGFQLVRQPTADPHSFAVRAMVADAGTHRDAELRVTFEYPAGWQFGGVPRPFVGTTCNECFAPSVDVEHPYGVQLFHYANLSEEDYLGCAITCFVGNNSTAPGGVDPLATAALRERDLEVAGLPARQLDIGRQVPLGIASTTGDYTPNEETWTLIRHEGRVIFFVSYHRLGDDEGERETAAALELMLSTLRFD